MRALLLTAVDHLEVDEVPRPEPGDLALVAIERAGICGTDLKLQSGIPQVDYPRILGHELVGTVVKPALDGQVAEGTRVLVDPAVSCGRCHLCRRDRANLCPNGALMGRDVDGGFAEYVAVDERQLLPIPDAVSVEDAGLLQVVGVCVRAQTLIDTFPRQSAAVVGLGVGGLIHTQLLRARGMDPVIGITRSAEKRALAERLGATATCHPDDAEEFVAELTDGRGIDVVVESVGKVETLGQSVRIAGGGATVLAYGSIGAEQGELPFYELYRKELRIVGSRAALVRDYATSIDLVASGTIEVGALLSSAFPLEQGPEAFEALRTRSELVKVVLDVA